MTPFPTFPISPRFGWFPVNKHQQTWMNSAGETDDDDDEEGLHFACVGWVNTCELSCGVKLMLVADVNSELVAFCRFHHLFVASWVVLRLQWIHNEGRTVLPDVCWRYNSTQKLGFVNLALLPRLYVGFSGKSENMHHICFFNKQEMRTQ